MLKKLIAGFLGAAVMTCGMTMITAGAVDTASTAVRTVIVKTQGDDTGGYLEVGLQVDGGTKLASVAATLTYDASKLTPYAWEGDAAVDLSGKTGWTAAAAIPTKAPDNISGKASVAYAEGTAGHLMLSAEAIQPVTLSQAAPGATMTEPVAQVVTMRMKYTGTFAAAASSIKYDAAATGSPAGGTVVLSDGTASTTYTGGQSATVTSGKTVAGTSGAAGDGEFVSIVFYDWDDTQLGSIAVQKGQDATEAVKKFAEEADVAAKLAAHEGYAFENKWVLSSSNAPTIYGAYRDATGSATTIAEPTVDTGLASFTKVDQSMSVNAAYSTAVTLGSNAVADRQTVTYVGAERLNTAGVYALTFETNRGNKTTSLTPYARATVTNANGSVLSGVTYSGRDTDTIQVIVDASTTEASVVLVDAYQASYATAAAKSGTSTAEAKRGTSEGYVSEGTLKFLANAIANNKTMDYGNANIYKNDLGIATTLTGGTLRTAVKAAYDELGNGTLTYAALEKHLL